MQPAPESITAHPASDLPIPSFAKSNRELLEAFETYLVSRNRSAPTLRSYLDSVGRLLEVLGSKDAAELDRSDIRRLQSLLLAKGLSENSIRLHTAAIRAFSEFLRLAGLTRHDPTLLLSQRKLPSRVPRVLTPDEIERLVAACETPLERAVVEVLYATGVRISELVALRVEDITFSEPGVIRVLRGKGDKDRIVLFGRHAAAAVGEYLGDRRSGFLFEAPARTGQLFKNFRAWYARFYVNGEQREVWLGRIRGESHRPGRGQRRLFLSEPEAREKFERMKADTPGFTAHPPRPYDARSIRLLLTRLAFRAGVAGVHPHSFRRSAATHMLASGADLRAIQDLLGHERVTSNGFVYEFVRCEARRGSQTVPSARRGRLKMPRENNAAVEVLGQAAPNIRAQLDAYIEQKLAEMIGADFTGILEPFFQRKAIAREIRKLQTLPQQQKWSNYFAEWGCLVCAKKDVRYQANGMCQTCHQRTSLRLQTILRFTEKERPDSPPFAPDPTDLARAAVEGRHRRRISLGSSRLQLRAPAPTRTHSSLLQEFLRSKLKHAPTSRSPKGGRSETRRVTPSDKRLETFAIAAGAGKRSRSGSIPRDLRKMPRGRL